MSIYTKLNAARIEFHGITLKKTGRNNFAGYDYFELGDFLVPALKAMANNGLCAFITFGKEAAAMRIVDVDKPDEAIVIESPMSECALKGCHPVQNLGAVQTYTRRYLWVAALEIVEHDALNMTQKNAVPEEPPAINPDLLKASQDAAAKGVAEYRKYWTSATPEQRAELLSVHNANKTAAEQADKK